MSKKKTIRLISVIVLVGGVIISAIAMFRYEIWRDLFQVIGFIALSIGTAGSVLSVFIPQSYSYNFKLNDWKRVAQGHWIASIAGKKHGMGKNPMVVIMIKNSNGRYENVVLPADHSIDAINGDFTISNYCATEDIKVIIS